MRRFSLVELFIGAVIIVVLTFVFYGVWYEMTFDYTECQTTEQYRKQHSSAWIQTIQGVNGIPTTYIHHPARDWVERLYSCPSKKGQNFDKWRTENKS